MSEEKTIIKQLNQDEIRDFILKKDYELYKYKKILDKIKEKVSYYRSAKYGTYDSDDILADLSYILMEEIE